MLCNNTISAQCKFKSCIAERVAKGENACSGPQDDGDDDDDDKKGYLPVSDYSDGTKITLFHPREARGGHYNAR